MSYYPTNKLVDLNFAAYGFRSMDVPDFIPFFFISLRTGYDRIRVSCFHESLFNGNSRIGLFSHRIVSCVFFDSNAIPALTCQKFTKEKPGLSDPSVFIPFAVFFQGVFCPSTKRIRNSQRWKIPDVTSGKDR